MKNTLYAATTTVVFSLLGCGESSEDLLQAYIDQAGEVATEGFVFTAGCQEEPDLVACDACCDGEGFDAGAILADDCGCTYEVSDREVCASSADSAECLTCCTGAGFLNGLDFGGGCTCTKNSETP